MSAIKYACTTRRVRPISNLINYDAAVRQSLFITDFQRDHADILDHTNKQRRNTNPRPVVLARGERTPPTQTNTKGISDTDRGEQGGTPK